MNEDDEWFHPRHASNAPEFGAHGGDDLWILAQFPEGYVGTAVEAGALDGRYLSNTLLLEQKGWTCYCVEPNPRYHEDLKKNRKNPVIAALGAEYVSRVRVVETPKVYRYTKTEIDFTENPTGEVSVHRLDDLLEGWGVKKLDVLSLDTDGSELDILSAFDPDRWGTTVLVLEVNGGDQDPVHLWAVSKGFEKKEHLMHNYCYRRTL